MLSRRSLKLAVLASGAAVLPAVPALAHPGPAGHDLIHGLAHPVSGWDHLLAMFAVGMLGARLGRRAVWALPLAFLAAMCLGSLAGGLGLALPGVELGIVASVLVLGALVAAAGLVSVPAATAVVALFAVFHGLAHASEMMPGASATRYALGFVLATALLHVAGIVVAGTLSRFASRDLVRWAGGAVSLAGLLLWTGWL